MIPPDSPSPHTEAGKRLLEQVELDNPDVMLYGILAIEAEAAPQARAVGPEGLLECPTCCGLTAHKYGCTFGLAALATPAEPG